MPSNSVSNSAPEDVFAILTQPSGKDFMERIALWERRRNEADAARAAADRRIAEAEAKVEAAKQQAARIIADAKQKAEAAWDRLNEFTRQLESLR